MLDARTLEILMAIKCAAVCTPDLRQLLETVQTTIASRKFLEAARVEVQADHGTNPTEVTHAK